MKKCLLIALICLIVTGCGLTPCKLEPNINYSPDCHQIDRLPSAFAPMASEESNQDWSRELFVGDHFAKEMDFYRAITAYKSAIFLLPSENIDRRLQLEYNIILSYYLAGKYHDAVNAFEQSPLTVIPPHFPALDTLLTILYDSYLKIDQCETAERVLQVIEQGSPETANDLMLYTLVVDADLPSLESWNCKVVNCEPESCELGFSVENGTSSGLDSFLGDYHTLAKSPRKAQFLNAVLPGMGYYYVGQKRTALTSFIINVLFIAAAYQFFEHGYPAAGLITTSLEMGWYFGGINGAGIEAQQFNNIIYENRARKYLQEDKLFPVLVIGTAF